MPGDHFNVMSPTGEPVTLGGPLPAPYNPLMARLGQVEAALAGVGITPKQSVWPMLLAGVGGGIAGAIIGYVAGGFVCRVRKGIAGF